MEDLISRQAAIDALDYGNSWEHMGMTLIDRDDAKSQIDHLPSVQSEIIRCKDCAKRVNCRTSNVWAVAPGDDWYCADAERRTDVTD